MAGQLILIYDPQGRFAAPPPGRMPPNCAQVHLIAPEIPVDAEGLAELTKKLTDLLLGALRPETGDQG